MGPVDHSFIPPDGQLIIPFLRESMEQGGEHGERPAIEDLLSEDRAVQDHVFAFHG
jgi:hypothetical protein